jgi:hypothetical protein
MNGANQICGMIHVSPGEHGEGVETPCQATSIGVTEDGVRVCGPCAAQMTVEGFRVDSGADETIE